MVSDSFDTWELSQLWANIMPLLILATLTGTLFVLSPWGRDPLYSTLTHFLILWPLLLLATLTYIAKVKLYEEEKEVPSP